MEKGKISLCLWCLYSEETVLDRCPNCGKPLLKKCVSCGRELAKTGQKYCGRKDCPDKAEHFLDLLFNFKSFLKSPLNRFALEEVERLNIFTESEINRFKEILKKNEILFDWQKYCAGVNKVSVEDEENLEDIDIDL